MVRTISAYGTKIISDITFPLDFPVDAETRYEVRLSSIVPARLRDAITLGFPFYQAHGRNVYLYSNRELDGSRPGQPWCYQVKDIVKFFWAGGERTIYYEMEDKGTESLLSFWLIHLLLPLYFTLEDMYDLFHAGAVEIDGKPVLFIAPSKGGKSTLTDYFIRQGHTLISDDKVPTYESHGAFMLTGAHPYHRPYRRFEELGYFVKNFMGNFKPIHAFYTLEAVSSDAEILIEEINGFEKFHVLLPNYLYMFPFLMPKRLNYLSKLLNGIKVFRVRLPWDLRRVAEVYEAICEHGRKVS
jgi:hypothetical protein